MICILCVCGEIDATHPPHFTLISSIQRSKVVRGNSAKDFETVVHYLIFFFCKNKEKEKQAELKA